MILLNELGKLFGRKQFILLLAVLFFGQMASLVFFEKNTEDYVYLYENREACQKYREEWTKRQKEAESRGEETEYVDDPGAYEVIGYYEKMLSEEASYPEEYRIFIDEMPERTEQLKLSNILLGKDPFRNTDLDKTLKDYEILRDTKIVPGNYVSVKKYGSHMTGVLFEIGAVLLILFYGFCEDKEKGRYGLLRSTRKGRQVFYLNKTCAMILAAVLYTVLQECSSILLFSLIYGTGTLSAPVQSVPLFRNTSIPMSIWGMYLRSLFYKSLCLSVLLVLFLLAGTLFGRTHGAVISVVGFLVISFFLWNSIPAAHPLRALRYVNFFSLYLPSDSIGAYSNLNLFGKAVEKRHIVLSLAFFLLAGQTAAGTLLFSAKNQITKDGRFTGLFGKIRKTLRFTQEIRSLWLLELYKPLFQQKKILLIVLILIYGVSLIRNAADSVQIADSENALYEYYADMLAGEYGDEQKQIIEREDRKNREDRESADALLEEAAKLRKMADDMGEEEKKEREEAYKEAYLNEQRARYMMEGLAHYESALLRVKNQSMMLEERAASTGKPVYFVNKSAYRRYFRRIKDRLSSFLILSTALILMTSGFYAMDERYGMTSLIRSTPEGRAKIRHVRTGLMLLLAFMSFLVFLIPELRCLYRLDQFRTLNAALGDFFAQGPDGSLQEMKIGQLLSAAALIRLGGFVLLGAASLGFSRKLKNELAVSILLIGPAVVIVVFGYLFRTDLLTFILNSLGMVFG